MEIRKNGAWTDLPYRKYHANQTTLPSLPEEIVADGQPLTSYRISGNLVQTGTPTPDNPIQPEETGDLVTTGEHSGEYVLPVISGGVTTPVYLSEPLRKIGEYADTKSMTEEYRAIGKIDFSELSWSLLIPPGLWITTGIPNIKYVSTNKELGNGIAEKYKIHTGSGMSTAIGCIAIDVTQVSVNTGSDKKPSGMFWYVLATPTTETITAPTIPTINGSQAFDVDTTLKPSEVKLANWWENCGHGKYYDNNTWKEDVRSWYDFRRLVRSGNAAAQFPVGTMLYDNWGDDTSTAFRIVGYDNYFDDDLTAKGYTHSCTLLEELSSYPSIQFDAIEAWLYATTTVPAGTYRFTIPNYDATHGGNKTYIFTSTADVPANGQLTLTWTYQQNPTRVQGYASSTSTTALFNVTIAEWDGEVEATNLGTIKLAMSDADSTYGKLNHIHRARYGSNNYHQSGIRQWLNSNSAANTWWQPTNIFDRPYTNRTSAGRLTTLNGEFVGSLATPTVGCITNNLFETGFALQTAYNVKDKLFLVTHTEVNLSSNPNVGSVLAYYTGADNTKRIKHRKDNGNAVNWWLRTPYPSHASSERNVTTSGALNDYNASNSYSALAACIIQ